MQVMQESTADPGFDSWWGFSLHIMTCIQHFLPKFGGALKWSTSKVHVPVVPILL